MTSPVPASDIFNNNPYGSHPSLTTTEAEILWEYAKLAQHVKLVSMLGSISPTTQHD
jgi:DASH complex subunit DAD3